MLRVSRTEVQPQITSCRVRVNQLTIDLDNTNAYFLNIGLQVLLGHAQDLRQIALRRANGFVCDRVLADLRCMGRRRFGWGQGLKVVSECLRTQILQVGLEMLLWHTQGLCRRSLRHSDGVVRPLLIDQGLLIRLFLRPGATGFTQQPFVLGLKVIELAAEHFDVLKQIFHPCFGRQSFEVVDLRVGIDQRPLAAQCLNL